jgi:hypothetical protein
LDTHNSKVEEPQDFHPVALLFDLHQIINRLWQRSEHQ